MKENYCILLNWTERNVLKPKEKRWNFVLKYNEDDNDYMKRREEKWTES